MTEQALSGLYCCAQTLIPSLFPLMALAEFLSEYGIFDRLAFIISPLCKKAFKLPPAAGGAIILSMVGGFPVGAACCASLYSRGSISRTQACRMMRFAVGAGPAFVIFALGQNMLKNTASGIALYIAQILSQLTILIVGALFVKEEVVNTAQRKKAKGNFTDTLIHSCFKASDSMLKLCAVVVLFSAFMGVLSDTGLSDLLSRLFNLMFIPKPVADSLLYALTEVSAGCLNAVQNGAPLEFIAFAVGFGGLSVHFQIFALLTELDFSKLDFMLHRLLGGTLCALYTFVMKLLLHDTAVQTVSLSVPSEVVFSSSTIAGSGALILCCIVFVLSVRVKKSK